MTVLMTPATNQVELAPERQRELYETMVLARRTSERLWQLQRSGLIALSVPCDGHEAVQVGSAFALPKDPAQRVVYPYYRSLASVLAYGMTPRDIFLASFARRTDPSTGGRQMTAHYSTRDLNIITTSSVIATQIPHAVGAAYAARLRRLPQVAITYFGDGATSAGDFHEGVNFAAIHRLPVIFVCENNGYAISVPLRKQMAIADVADRAASYGIAGVLVDGNDAEAVYAVTKEAVERAERGEGPTLIEAKTYRLTPHTSDDDDRGYRPADEIASWRQEREPIARYARVLEERGVLDGSARQEIEERVRQTIDQALAEAEASADPDPAELLTSVYAQ